MFAYSLSEKFSFEDLFETRSEALAAARAEYAYSFPPGEREQSHVVSTAEVKVATMKDFYSHKDYAAFLLYSLRMQAVEQYGTQVLDWFKNVPIDDVVQLNRFIIQVFEQWATHQAALPDMYLAIHVQTHSPFE